MTLRYTLTPPVLKIGAGKHFDRQTRIPSWLRTGIGLAAIVFGIVWLAGIDFNGTASLAFLFPVIYILLGAFLTIRRPLWIRRCVRNTFAGKGDAISITLHATEEGLSVESQESSGKSDWSAFVDHLTDKDGVIIYPQKNLFVFVPSSAEVDGATFQEFVALVQKKVIKKV